MKIIIFYNTLKANRIDERFEEIQKTFQNCKVARGYCKEISKCDLAIIQGWMKVGGKGPHNEFRRRIIEHQLQTKKHVLSIDGNIFNFVIKGKYFRYSIDGIFANTGYYFDDIIDPSRWDTMKKDIGYDLKPWRMNGNHVVILMQKDSGWTMENRGSIEWCSETIDEIRKHTNRQIVIRTHPSDTKIKEKYELLSKSKNVMLSQSSDIREDLDNAWCAISYNSSPGAVSAMEGIPVFIMDKDYRKSPAFLVGNTDITKIEDPIMPDRTEWIQRIAMSHFSVDDIKSGLLWKEVSQYFEVKKKQ